MKRKSRFFLVLVAFTVMLTGIFPVTVAQAAPNAFIFVKGSPTVTYTEDSPKFLYVGGKSYNFDYSVDGQTKGISGTWKSSNTDIVKVNKSSGLAKAVGNGTAQISYTFTFQGRAYTMKTYVKCRTRASAVKIYAYDPSDFDGTMEVGDSVDFNRKLTVNPKALKVNSKVKSTYKTYCVLYDDAACTQEHDGGVASLGDGGVVTAEADGTVYLRANSRNSKTNFDYSVDSNIIKIVVGDGVRKDEEEKPAVETGAKQTDVNKITVTSKEDITKVTVKLGNTTLTQKAGSPEISEDRKTAVITLPGNFQEKIYTVYINDSLEGLDVNCTTRTLDRIELDSNFAVLDKLMATTVGTEVSYPVATVKYKIYDQFGNDLTTDPTYSYKEFSSGGLFQPKSNGVLTYTVITTPVIGTKYDIVLVHNKTGKNVKAEVELANPAYVDSISFAGIYKYDATQGKYLLMADGSVCNMSEGDDPIIDFGSSVNNTKTNGAYYLLFKATNQYGGNSAGPGVNFSQLVVNLSSGLTNLMLDTVNISGVENLQSINAISIDNVDYLAYPLRAGSYKEGKTILTAYAVNSSANVTAEIDIGAAHKIVDLSVSPTETLYEGKTTYLDYTAVDSYGNSITDYDTLVKYCNLVDSGSTAQFPATSTIISSTNTYGKSTFMWERQEDGSAKLKYIPYDSGTQDSTANMNIRYVDTLTLMAATINVKFATFDVYSKPIPTQIYGIDSNASLGALVGGNKLILRQKDIKIVDQYGAEMPNDLVKKSKCKFVIDNYTPNSFFVEQSIASPVQVNAGTDNLDDGTGIYKPIVNLTTTDTSGSASFRISIEGKNNSGYNVTVRSVGTDTLVRSAYKIEDIGLLYNGTAYDSKKTQELIVTGAMADGTRISIPSNRYTVIAVGDAAKFVENNKINPTRERLATLLGKDANPNGNEMEFDYMVVVDDQYGTEVKTKVKISDKNPHAATFTLDPGKATVKVGEGAPNLYDQLVTAGKLEFKDQYGQATSASAIDIIRFTVTAGADVKVSKNGTQFTQIQSLSSNSVTVKIYVNDMEPVSVVLVKES